jgi:Myosin tail
VKEAGDSQVPLEQELRVLKDRLARSESDAAEVEKKCRLLMEEKLILSEQLQVEAESCAEATEQRLRLVQRNRELEDIIRARHGRAGNDSDHQPIVAEATAGFTEQPPAEVVTSSGGDQIRAQLTRRNRELEALLAEATKHVHKLTEDMTVLSEQHRAELETFAEMQEQQLRLTTKNQELAALLQAAESRLKEEEQLRQKLTEETMILSEQLLAESEARTENEEKHERMTQRKLELEDQILELRIRLKKENEEEEV